MPGSASSMPDLYCRGPFRSRPSGKAKHISGPVAHLFHAVLSVIRLDGRGCRTRSRDRPSLLRCHRKDSPSVGSLQWPGPPDSFLDTLTPGVDAAGRDLDQAPPPSSFVGRPRRIDARIKESTPKEIVFRPRLSKTSQPPFAKIHVQRFRK